MEVNGPFKYVNSINDHKEIEVDGTYNKFLINRHYSYFIDTIFDAAQFSTLDNNISNNMHYDSLFNSIRPKKRFSKWYKKEKNAWIEIIMEYYECNQLRAIEILDVLTEESRNEIEEWKNNKKEKMNE